MAELHPPMRLVAEFDLDAVMYAGDDVADEEAFDELDRLAAQDVRTIKVAVKGPETPALKEQWKDEQNVRFLTPATNEEVRELVAGCDRPSHRPARVAPGLPQGACEPAPPATVTLSHPA